MFYNISSFSCKTESPEKPFLSLHSPDPCLHYCPLLQYFTTSIRRTAGGRIKQKIMLLCFPFYHIRHLTQAIRKQLKASVSAPHPVQILALILFF